MFVMTSDGSALTRFERAVKIGNPNIVLAAAHELPKPMLLRDALRVVPRVRRRRAGAVPRRRGAVRSAADQRAPALGRRGATRVRCLADPRGPRPGAGRRGALRPAGAPPRDRSRSVSGAMASAIDVGGPVARRAGRNSPPGPATTTDCERWAHAVKVASAHRPRPRAPLAGLRVSACAAPLTAPPHLRSEVAGGGERQHPARETLRLLRPAAE